MQALWQDGGDGPYELTRLSASGMQGGECHGWLATTRTPGSSPLPVLVWLHGGPIGSWTHWLRGWSVPVALELGYAVILPDPALSSGYGDEHVSRGWGQWGQAPLADVTALMDAAFDGALTPVELDRHRCAVMGGSFGGYLALQLLINTSRFRCGVVQSAPADLARFSETSDSGHYFRRELGVQAVDSLPDLSLLDAPLLLVHGALDRRVPLEQALALWARLNEPSLAFDRGHRFLYFPDEGHSIRRAANLQVWYDVMQRFLATHLLDEPTGRIEWL